MISPFIPLVTSSGPPGDIQTQPNKKFVFNSPYDNKHIYYIKINNLSDRRIGWEIKTTVAVRMKVYPNCGVLKPKEAVLITISCNPFDFASVDTSNDCIIVEWTNTPEGAAKKFCSEWFKGDGIVRRKDLPIEYIP